MIQCLAADEYDVLKQFPDGFSPDPKSSVALVAFEDGKPVGRVFLMQPVHLEGPFVKEERRGTRLGYQLVKRAETEAKLAKISKLFAYATDEALADYLQRIGYQKEPMTVWSKEI